MEQVHGPYVYLKPSTPWRQDHKKQESLCSSVFCFIGLDGMLGVQDLDKHMTENSGYSV